MVLFGTSNCALITAAVAVLACGVVLFYCHTRMQQMETALLKQHQVLSSFICNIENEIRSGTLLMKSQPQTSAATATTDYSTPEALAAARQLQAGAGAGAGAGVKASYTDSRIEVSENDDEDTSSDSSSDSESDDEKEQEPKQEKSDIVLKQSAMTPPCLSPVCKVEDIKIIELPSTSVLLAADLKLNLSDDLTAVDMNLLGESSDDDEEDDEDDDEQEQEHEQEQEQEHELNNDSDLEIITVTLPVPVDTEPVPTTTTALLTVTKLLPTVSLQYDGLKVEELRKKVVDLSLATKDEAKKLKKNELLALLKSGTA